RENPLAHKYGDTTSSPKSRSDLCPPIGPPASTSKVLPCGDTSRIESPCPTSMALTSITAERNFGCGGTKVIHAATAVTTSNPHAAKARLARDVNMAATSAPVPMRITINPGVG